MGRPKDTYDSDGEGGDERQRLVKSKLASYTAPKHVMEDIPVEEGGHGGQEPQFGPSRKVVDLESDYSKRRLNRALSPTRKDAFSSAPGEEGARSYADIMRENQLALERENTMRNIEMKKREEEEADGGGLKKAKSSRWDSWGRSSLRGRRQRKWRSQASGMRHQVDGIQKMSLPLHLVGVVGCDACSRRMETPMYGAPGQGAQSVPMTPELYQAMKIEKEIEYRNRPLSDEELDAMLPGPSDGYKILEVPAGYVPIQTPARKLTATPAPVDGTPLYAIPEEDRTQAFDVPVAVEGLPDMKVEDQQYFGKLLKDVDESSLSLEEAKERKIMKLLLKVKNGTPPQRKNGLKHLTEKARSFGAGPLFNQILPLLMSPTLEDQERHLLVKVIDRILFRLDDLVRPYVHKILVVIEPLLIDEDYYARAEGREIIANLAKAAGLATMIAAMRPDIDNVDEYVRNTTAGHFLWLHLHLGSQQCFPSSKRYA
eukprot:jgi/Picre1/28782/NNA_004179.t1